MLNSYFLAHISMRIAFARQVSPGAHRVAAAIYDAEGSVQAENWIDITVPSCPADTTNESSGGGDEADCCPGPDPVERTSRPQVRGVMSSNVAVSWDGLTPLNRVFRSVFGRTPTFSEWTYWADRYLHDKPAWDAIHGAMQWQLLRGNSAV